MSTAFRPELVTLEQLVAAFPIGPWAGDDRLVRELDHFYFFNTVCAKVALSAGSDNEYRKLASSLELSKHNEMILSDKGREATQGMVGPELTQLYLAREISLEKFEDVFVQAGDPRALMAMMMGVHDGSGPTPGIRLCSQILDRMAHAFIGLAMMRALPGYPFLPSFLNWSIVRARTVFICSYNLPDGEGGWKSVDATGAVLATKEDAFRSLYTDPRIPHKPTIKVDGNHHEAVRALMEAEPGLVYEV